MEETNVSTREHVVDGPLSSGSREALHFVERLEITAALNLPSSLLPFALRSLSLSIVLCLFLSVLVIFFFSFSSSFFLSLFLPLLSSSPSFVLCHSNEQRASRSRAGHVPVRVKVSSVLRRAFLPLRVYQTTTFDDHYLSATTTFRDTSDDTRRLPILHT